MMFKNESFNLVKMTKKKSVKKKIIKKIQKDKAKKKKKDKKDKETHDKVKAAIEGGMSKLEYQQNLLDPKFRAAMVGFGGFPFSQSGMSNANQYLQEHREKNNELTREMAFKQDMAKLQQENKDLQRQTKSLNKELKRQEKERIAKQQNEDLQNELTQARKTYQENTKLAEANRKLQNEIDHYKRKLNKEKRKLENEQNTFNLQEKKSKVEHDLSITEKEAQYQPMMLKLEERLNIIKQQMEQNKNDSQHFLELQNLMFELGEAQVDAEHQDMKARLKHEISELQRQAIIYKQDVENETEIAKLESERQSLLQKADPNLAREHVEKARPGQLLKAKMEKNIQSAKYVDETNTNVEKLNQKFDELGFKIWGQEYNTEWKNQTDIQDRIKAKQVEAQIQYQNLERNVKELERIKSNQEKTKELDEKKVALEHQAELSEAENKASRDAVLNILKQQRQLAAATQTNLDLSQRLQTFKVENWQSIVRTEQDYNTLMDEVDVFFSAAREVAMELDESPSVKHLPKTLEKLNSDREKMDKLVAMNSEIKQLKEARAEQEKTIRELNEKYEIQTAWAKAEQNENIEKQKRIQQLETNEQSLVVLVREHLKHHPPSENIKILQDSGIQQYVSQEQFDKWHHLEQILTDDSPIKAADQPQDPEPEPDSDSSSSSLF